MGNKPRELLNSREVAERLGVSRSVVSHWRKRHPDFPQPVHENWSGWDTTQENLYDYKQVKKWYKKHLTNH